MKQSNLHWFIPFQNNTVERVNIKWSNYKIVGIMLREIYWHLVQILNHSLAARIGLRLLCEHCYFIWKENMRLKIIFFPMFRLVTADVAFYTGNLQALKGLKDLDLNMAEIWEQKRWWHTGKLGSSFYHGMCMFVPVIQELNLEPKVNWGWGRGKGKYQCWETGIHWDLQGMPFVCFLQWGVTDQVSIIFFILSGNRLRFLWTKSKRTHSCNTAVVD